MCFYLHAAIYLFIHLPIYPSLFIPYLIIEECGEPDGEDLEDAALEEGDLVVLLQALETRNEFGKRAHLKQNNCINNNTTNNNNNYNNNNNNNNYNNKCNNKYNNYYLSNMIHKLI